MKQARGIALTAMLVTLTSGAFAAAPTFTATMIGPPGSDFVSARGINAAGDTTGSADFRAFIQSGSTIRDLGTFGGPSSIGNSINAHGQVAGSAQTAGGYDHAFLFSGTLQDLGTLGGANSWAYAINDAGQVTGKSNFGLFPSSRAFLYSGGTMHDLGTLGGEDSVGTAINVKGQVTGGAAVVGGDSHAFVYSGGTMTDLGTGPGEASAGNAINDVGQVTGSVFFAGITTHAFLYSGGALTDIGTLGGSYSSGVGINSSGQVVGSSTISTGAARAFLYTEGRMYDLNALVVSGLAGRTLTAALAINDQGQIVAQSCLPPGPFDLPPQCKSFRLDVVSPIPITPQAGLWWNSDESGSGYAIDIQHGVVVVTVYSYNQDGTAQWYLMSGPLSNNTVSGPLQKFKSGQCISCTYKAPAVNGNDGTMTVVFTSATTASVTLPGGRSFTIVTPSF